MLTKTGQLLMRRKNQKNDTSHNRNEANKQDNVNTKMARQVKPYKKQKSISHVTHVNQYNFICVNNKSSHELQVSKQILNQLQVQNFRLIEQNMKLVEWSRNFLFKTKQQLLRTIQGIEQFRYLQSANKLYQLIGQLTEYQQTGFQMPKVSNKQHYLNLKKFNNPESKNIIPPELQIRNLINFVYKPIQNNLTKDIKQQKEVITPTFLNLTMKPDYADYEPTEGQQHFFNILLMQSLCIQSFVQQNMA